MCGLVVHSAAGTESYTLKALHKLKAVYGSKYRSLVTASDFALASLKHHIHAHGMENLMQWNPPCEGVYVGKTLHTTTNTIAEAVRVSFVEWSSLYENPLESASDESTVKEHRWASLSASRLETIVKEVVSKARPDLEARFAKKYSIKTDARPMRLGFVGQKIVTNFALIVPNSLGALVGQSKAKLWDLASAREGLQSGWFQEEGVDTFELLIQHASRKDVQYSDRQLANVTAALAELEAEADKLDIRSRAVETTDLMASHLLSIEG